MNIFEHLNSLILLFFARLFGLGGDTRKNIFLQLGLFASNLGSFSLDLEHDFHLILIVSLGVRTEPINSIFKVIFSMDQRVSSQND